MRILLLVLFFFGPFKQDKILICRSDGAYAYHKTVCTGLKACTHTVEKVTLSEAVRLKRKPCHYCYGSVTATVAQEAAAPGQCGAITKKGTRCSRSARSDGYCWQHGG